MLKKLAKIGISILLVLSIVITMFALVPFVSAKDLNWSSDISKIDYINAGGDADFFLPTTLPLNYPSGFTQMRLRAAHFEMPNADLSYNNLLVFLYDPARAAVGKNPWQPYAMITDGPDAEFQKTFWSGTFVEFKAELYTYPSTAGPLAGKPLPVSWGTNNVIQVDKGVLSIERHGNNMVVTLNAEQSIKKIMVSPSATSSFKLPSFSLELSSYGEAYHRVASEEMTGWLGGSGYTITHKDLQFDANGVFTSQGSFLDGTSTTNAKLVMHGTHTFLYP
jgi:hypothetical protein